MSRWKQALEIEHQVARIMSVQERNGILFDKERAIDYVEQIELRCEEIYEEVLPYLRKELVVNKTPVNRPFLKSGEYSRSVLTWLEDAGPWDVGGPFTRIKYEDLRLSQTQKLKDQLLELGWQPTEWNFSNGERTSPKITEDSLESLTSGVGKDLREWVVLDHRRGQIQGWIDRVRPDGRLTAGAITCGTPTGRMRHRIVVNVPKATRYSKGHEKAGELIWDIKDQPVIFGTQMRSLFIVPDGKLLVGHDASGLELRMLAHYMNDPDFTEALLQGDIHTFNMERAGLTDREQAKTFIYGFLYGAGPAKIGSIVGGGYKEGLSLQRRFFEGLPKLKRLIENVQRASQRGFLYGLDGRKMHIRGQHAALNTLLQGAGAIVMKQSMILLDQWVRDRDLRVLKVLDMHDEAQAEVIPEHAELYASLAVQSIKEAGKLFKLNCPLDGEAKIGHNWAETH